MAWNIAFGSLFTKLDSHFVFPWVSSELRRLYLPSHRFFGILGLLLAAVVMETGIVTLRLYVYNLYME